MEIPKDNPPLCIPKVFYEKNKLKRKVQNTETIKSKRRALVVKNGKRVTEELFNGLPSEPEVQLWISGVTSCIPSDEVSFALLLHSISKVSDLHYVIDTDTKGFAPVLDFIKASSHCSDWLDCELKSLGWTTNLTGYDPIAVSNCASELLTATVECRNMAAKQMRQIYPSKINNAWFF
jgi:hypothetical protein